MFVSNGLIGRCLNDKRAATAIIVAATLPAMTITAGAGLDWALIQATHSRLQAVADSSANAGREHMNANQSGSDTNATHYALANVTANGFAPSSVTVNQGWWEIGTGYHTARAHSFGPCLVGQRAGTCFNNAIQVITRATHTLVFGGLLGVPTTVLQRQAVAYKCSNTDYPITYIPPDKTNPNGPDITGYWAEPTAPTIPLSYFYTGSDLLPHPVFKFYSDTDALDVSFVIHGSKYGDGLQVDTYCAGTYLVVPGNINLTGRTGQETFTIKRGSTNNSLDTFPDNLYPLAHTTTTYNYDAKVPIPAAYIPSGTNFVTYPHANNGTNDWYYNGIPTPPRQTVAVQDPVNALAGQ